MSSGGEFTIAKIPELIGKTFVEVTGDVFTLADGRKYVFEHIQDCCESVGIEDVVGDLSDLENTPILDAEERSMEADDPRNDDHGTWSFYSFTTAKGTVVVRWYGESNGYYSEGVDHGWRK